MAYELQFFVSDAGSHTVDEVVEFLRRRWHYETRGGEAEYLNADTGVQFELRWTTGEGDEVEELTFCMDCRRPRFFATEAAEELEALAEALSVEVDASSFQSEGFDAEGFVEDWGQENVDVLRERGVEEFEPGEHPSLEEEKLHRAWRWNRDRRHYQKTVPAEVFVPRILYFDRNGTIERGVVWPDAIPIALPDVEFVLVTPPEESDESSEARVVERRRLVEKAEPAAEARRDPMPHQLLRWDEPPEQLVRTLRSEGERAEPRSLTGLPPRRVFEAELIARWRD